MSDNVHFDNKSSAIPPMEEQPELFCVPPKGDSAWARRTRVLALDAAAKVMSGAATALTTRLSAQDIADATAMMARTFEKYLDGEQAP